MLLEKVAKFWYKMAETCHHFFSKFTLIKFGCFSNLEMKNEYLSNHKLPEKFPHNNGKKVQQIDPKTKNVLKIYNSNRDVIKNFQISSIKLNECLETGQIHNGYIWKRIN